MNRPVKPLSPRARFVASASGTFIEWYDFFIYGSLATVLAVKFFPQTDPAVALLATLAGLGAGFVMRPIGAVFFGWLGDRRGRKKTFISTLIIMGVSTTLMGLIPTYETIGIAATVLLVFLRLAQGFAIGGEYGGAATFVAEHASEGRRGRVTSILQATQTLGVLAAVLFLVALRAVLGAEQFDAWGWRVPFLVSGVLVVLSFGVRLRISETPVFEHMHDAGSNTPLRAILSNPKTVGRILFAVFGVTAGMGAMWYASHSYSQVFLVNSVGMDLLQANIALAAALALGLPFFIIFGAWSDRVGRLPIIVTGMTLLTLTTIPLYSAMRIAAEAGNVVGVALTLLPQIIFVAMVNGPVGAYLVDLFAPAIRTTGVSIAYHLGTGIFGGFSPFIAQSIVTGTGNIMLGVLYPTIVAGIASVIGISALCVQRARRRNPSGRQPEPVDIAEAV